MDYRITYRELADRWQISQEAAKARVRRYRWQRQPQNDGTVIVTVPGDSLNAPPIVAPNESAPPKENPETAATLAALTKAHELVLNRLAETQAALLAEKDKTTAAEIRATIAETRLEGLQRQQRRSGLRSLLRFIRD